MSSRSFSGHVNWILQLPFSIFLNFASSFKHFFFDLPRKEQQQRLLTLKYQQNEQNPFVQLLQHRTLSVELAKHLTIAELFRLLQLCHSANSSLKHNRILWETIVLENYRSILSEPLLEVWKTQSNKIELCRRIGITEKCSRIISGSFSTRILSRTTAVSFNPRSFFFEYYDCDVGSAIEPFKSFTKTGNFLATEWIANSGLILELYPVESKRRLVETYDHKLVNSDCLERVNWNGEFPICGVKVIATDQQIYIQIPKLGNQVLSSKQLVNSPKLATHVDIFAPYRRLSLRWKELENFWQRTSDLSAFSL